MLPETTAVRLRTQLDTLPLLLAGVDDDALERRPAPGKWSAREQLAHLARHHEVTGERLRRILAEPEPSLPRYRAEEDPEWPRWAALPLAAVTAELAARRAGLVAAVAAIPPADLSRRGVHPVLGAMPIPLWLEFFLLHEAHHLFSTMQLVRAAPAAGQQR
ncbi:MAG TPA: DinB family protein [Thermoanaerobaculia bacterium]|nr:DinB family protein [Thermoanaerobaculia bacterium]